MHHSLSTKSYFTHCNFCFNLYKIRERLHIQHIKLFLCVPYKINTKLLLPDTANTKDTVCVTLELFHNFLYTRCTRRRSSDLIFHFLNNKMLPNRITVFLSVFSHGISPCHFFFSIHVFSFKSLSIDLISDLYLHD